MLIDTHCHIENKEYSDINELMDKIFKSDVEKIIISGYDVASSIEAIALAEKYNNVYATVGFHPENCNDIKEEDYELLCKWLDNKKVVGIGEIGLDYFYSKENDNLQKVVFNRQLAIAQEYKKPVVIHNREASDDIYDILKNYNVKGVIHCFNDNLEMANKFIGLGFLLGIGGIITFKNNIIKDVIPSISINNIVLETDSPYLSPVPLRGKQNSPLNLPLIASKIAEIKDTTYEEIAVKTSVNAMQLFDFDPKI